MWLLQQRDTFDWTSWSPFRNSLPVLRWRPAGLLFGALCECVRLRDDVGWLAAPQQRMRLRQSAPPHVVAEPEELLALAATSPGLDARLGEPASEKMQYPLMMFHPTVRRALNSLTCPCPAQCQPHLSAVQLFGRVDAKNLSTKSSVKYLMGLTFSNFTKGAFKQPYG